MASKAVFRVSVRGARRAGGKLNRAGRRLQRTLLDEMALAAPHVTRIYRRHAPHDSGRLERGLKASLVSRGGRIRLVFESTAVSEEGYAYTGVTRFGHRVRWIVPKPPRRFLRFYWRKAGRVVFMPRVKGYKPASDWVADARPEVEREFDAVASRIGRSIDSKLLR